MQLCGLVKRGHPRRGVRPSACPATGEPRSTPDLAGHARASQPAHAGGRLAEAAGWRFWLFQKIVTVVL